LACDVEETDPRKDPRRKRCLKNPVPAVVTTGFEDFWKGGSEPIALSEK
jgi:hypothetical protein